jgi:plasmid stabilization system protein ParE
MYKPIVWSPLTEKDFENILNYLDKNWGPNVALNFIEITENTLCQLSANPKQFPFAHKKEMIRKCVLSKHNTLFYRESKKQIAILRIYDTRQDPNNLKFK